MHCRCCSGFHSAFFEKDFLRTENLLFSISKSVKSVQTRCAVLFHCKILQLSMEAQLFYKLYRLTYVVAIVEIFVKQTVAGDSFCK